MGKVLIGNIKGPQGPTGVRGGMWLQGTAVTGTSTEETSFPDSNITYAIIGDAYFNVETCNVYACTKAGNPTDAKWVYTGNIKGVKGDTGSTQSIQNAVLEFNEALTRENIESTDTVETIFGKVKKYFTDLGSAAFMNVVNNVTQSEAGQAVLDAAVGKYLEEKKFDISKIIANRNITEPGFVMDGKTVADALTELNGNMGNGNFKFLVLYGTTPADPAKAIKENWNDLEDGCYIVKVSCGSVHLAFLYRIDNGKYGCALILGYGWKNPIVLHMFAEVWSPEQSLISKSDLGYIDCNVTTVANNRVPIPGAPSTNRGYIPVIVGHDTTSSVLDNAFYDAGEWRIYSTFAQHAVVRFYKYPV